MSIADEVMNMPSDTIDIERAVSDPEYRRWAIAVLNDHDILDHGSADHSDHELELLD